MKQIKLDDIEKKVPFEVPEDYFEQLTSLIQDKVYEKPKRQWIPTGQMKWAVYGILALILVAIVLFYPNTPSPTSQDLLAEVSDQDLLEYLDLNGFSGYELVDGMEDEDIDDLWEDDTFENLELDESELNNILIDYELDNLL